jgi:hypothetical protein
MAEERISRVKYDGHIDKTLRYFIQYYKILPEEISKVVITSFGQLQELKKETMELMNAYLVNIF